VVVLACCKGVVQMQGLAQKHHGCGTSAHLCVDRVGESYAEQLSALQVGDQALVDLV
jgi:hypothetical protein